MFAVNVYADNSQSTDTAIEKEKTKANKRIALVIGNDQYAHVIPLKNAVSDARSMAEALKKAKFAVTLKFDTNLADMKQAVRQFKANLSSGDEAIFYYSGHGVQIGGANFLLPVDIASDSEDQVKDDGMPLQRVLDDLQDQKVKFALAIIDACRDNPFKGKGRSIGGSRGLAPTSAADGQMIIFSAGTGQQALDKLGDADLDENGVFTRVFLQEMQRPGLEVHQLLRNARSRVVQMTKSVNHDQMPSLYDQAEGDFYFYGNVSPVSKDAVTSVPLVEGVSLDDIRNDQESRSKWGRWQQAMETDFYKIEALNVELAMQIVAWNRFLANYSQNNPFSELDKQLRTKAQLNLQTAKLKQQKQLEALNVPAQHAPGSELLMVSIPGKNYEIGKYDITQFIWREVMGSNPSKFTNCGDLCPVEQVSWNEVQEFIQKLNAKSGKQYRLPTEAEWEYACNAGSTNKYCGGDDLSYVGWFGANSKNTTHPVGVKFANAYGLYDMSGNVWQWMSDCFDSSCSRRVLRGGSWYYYPKPHDSLRYSYLPTDRYYGFGFRLARTLP